MAIQHTVVFRLIHEVGSAAEAEFLDAAARTLADIPGVTGFVVNRQVSPKSDLDWQFSMAFASPAEFDAYNSHPDHVAFVETRWLTEVASFQEYDFSPR